MLTILCVLRSGGEYTAEWVAKMGRALERHMRVPYRFVCLSDVDVPCERIELTEKWPGWWAKIAMFRPGVITGPTLYVDLDNVILQCLGPLAQPGVNFAMLKNFHRSNHASSSVMWFRGPAPAHVYEKFAENPIGWIHYHEKRRSGPYLGDQAFIFDALNRDVPFIETTKKAVLSYKCNIKTLGYLPQGVLMVCFGGSLRPSNVPEKWVAEAWA